MPGPRNDVSAVRLALSNDDLKTSLTPSESVTAYGTILITTSTLAMSRLWFAHMGIFSRPDGYNAVGLSVGCAP
jgi:hypothetical protein